MQSTKALLITTVIFLTAQLAFAQPITFERYFDLGNGDIEQAYCVQATFDGGYIMSGRKATFGTTKLLVMKVDSAGVYQWHKTYGENLTYNFGQSIQQTADSGYIVTGGMMEANGQNFVCLFKLNEQGDSVWLRKFTYTNQNAVVGVKVLQHDDGGYALISDVVDSVDLVWTAYLTRTDSDGNELWTQAYKKEQGTSPCSFLSIPDSGYIIAAYTNPSINDNDIYLIRTDAQGDTLWTTTVPHLPGFTYLLHRSNCINPTSDGGFIITGTAVKNASTERSILLIKTNEFGDTLWTRKLTGGNVLWGYAGGVQANDGGFVLAGIDETAGDCFLIRTDNQANQVWKQTFGGIYHEYANYLFPTADGGFAICGMEESWGTMPAFTWLRPTAQATLNLTSPE